MPFHILTYRQQQILTFIDQFSKLHGYSPVLREIAQALGISSTSVVAYNLRVLEKKGKIKRTTHIARAMHIPEQARLASVPVLGVVAAGLPLSLVSRQDAPEQLPLPPSMNIDTADVFALQVRGDSMIDAFIASGDTVLVRRQHTAENGQLVVATVRPDMGVTLKRFYDEETRYRLQPEHQGMEPIYVAKGDLFIEGRVVGVLRIL